MTPSGQTAYTRDGSFQINNQGQLVTASGYLIQPAMTIPATAQSVTVGKDGVMSVTLPNSPAVTNVGTLQLTTFMNPAGLSALGENLYSETAASGSPMAGAPGTNGTGTLQQGYVETSNVNVVEELVNMIQTQRAYEINSKAVTTSDQMLQKLAQLGG
jgi:flagellar basal-body rod protein FlgG